MTGTLTAPTPEALTSDPLARLVGDVEVFRAKHWTQRPLLAGSHEAGAFADLLSLEAVDAAVSNGALRAPALRLVRQGSPLPVSAYTRTGRLGSRTLHDLIDTGRVLDHFHAGATIVLQGLHRSHPPLRRFCRELELQLGHAVQANAYLTPPGAQGLRVHHDTHDVFALQVHGRKHWQVYEPIVEDPLPGQGWAADEATTPPVLDATLEPGAALYVPRGTPHAAATVAEASLHITLGVLTTTRFDVITRVLEQARDEPSFRRALPLGWADGEDGLKDVAAALEELAEWVRRRSAEDVHAAVAQQFWSSRQPILDGLLSQQLDLDSIDDATAVRRRPGIVARLSPAGEASVELILGDRRVRFPERAQPAVDRLLAARERPVRVGELGDLLDHHGRVVLVRRLIREGVLVVASASAADG